MEPIRESYRDTEIRSGWNVQTDIYRANFELLAERRPETGFQQSISVNMKSGIGPGKHYAEGRTKDEAVARAKEMIDSYLDNK